MCQRCLEATKECPSIIEAGKSTYLKLPYTIGYLYFFSTQDLSRIKIGFTKYDPYDRMKYFQKEENQKLLMIALWPIMRREVEKIVHKQFKHLRIDNKREWFLYDSDICGLLKELWWKYDLGFTNLGHINDSLWEENVTYNFHSE